MSTHNPPVPPKDTPPSPTEDATGPPAAPSSDSVPVEPVHEESPIPDPPSDPPKHLSGDPEQTTVESSEIIEKAPQNHTDDSTSPESDIKKHLPDPIDTSIANKPLEVEPEPERDQIANEHSNEQSAPSTPSVLSVPNTPSTSTQHHHRAFSNATTISTLSKSDSFSVVFIKKTMEAINKSKEAKKHLPLFNASKKALDKLNEDLTTLPQPQIVLEPLKIVCQSNNNLLKVLALDCISKLCASNYFEDPPIDENNNKPDDGITPPPKQPLIDNVITIVCDCFIGESTDEKVELQVVKALMAGILNDKIIVHGASLLKAIRQIYNIFILSFSNSNQITAQASLTQIINAIFDRVKLNDKRKSSASIITNNTVVGGVPPNINEVDVTIDTNSEKGKLTLKNFENINDDEDDLTKPIINTIDETSKTNTTNNQNTTDNKEIVIIGENDIFTKDAFLVFRTMCKLSVKPLESDTDMKSHPMRSKLLSLHMIHSILKSHMSVFLSQKTVINQQSSNNVNSNSYTTVFVDAIRQYLCLSLSRNAASIVPPVFEISSEIFWLLMSNLRSQFKRELEVFLREIYFPIAEMKTSTSHQKRYFLSIIQRLSNDPRALIEIYLNYDCDSNLENIFERLINYLSKISTTFVSLTPSQQIYYKESLKKPLASYNLLSLPAIAISNATIQAQAAAHHHDLFPVEYALKITASKCITGVLRSLFTWSQKGVTLENGKVLESSLSYSVGRTRSSTIGSNTIPPSSPTFSTPVVGSSSASLIDSDDPSQFSSLKQRKTALSDGIKLFNYSPKKGIENLIKNGFIESSESIDIARFLLSTDGLNKSQIGEYLGGKHEKEIAIMHAFVDLLDFTSMDFVAAMRKFLQSFRLPGESQQIDRFMLKFAEKYVSGNPNIFANADTAYVLAYSVIMLNTDQHSPQVKNRMTIEEFIKNNRGINENQDLPTEFLIKIYEDIQNDEIKLQSEQEAALIAGDLFDSNIGFSPLFSNRDPQREAYVLASKEMSSKTEKLVRNLSKISKFNNNTNNSNNTNGTTKKTVFYYASHVEHVKSIFESLWMSFLAAVTGPFQDYDDKEIIDNCSEGIKLSIKIACFFDIELARVSFIGTLCRFTSLLNLHEMKWKHLTAIKLLLELALSEGNSLKSSWKDILTCISQLERFQLIGSGIEAGSIPDVLNARIASPTHSRASTESHHPLNFLSFGSSNNNPTYYNQQAISQNFDLDVADAARSSEITIAMDKIFTQSAQLSGDAILDFVKALTAVASEESESSKQSENPRTFAIQKMVDICYYNMERIRVQWLNLWLIMGEQFNKVLCHPNNNIVFFALDSLRQLSVRFFEIEELAHFKFQKEFLKPFDYAITHNPNESVKEMVIDMLENMVQQKAKQIKSGWRTLFSTLAHGAKDSNEKIVRKSYELTHKIVQKHFDFVYSQGAFSDVVVCFTDLAKNEKFQRISLHALEILRNLIKQVANISFGSNDDTKLGVHVVLKLNNNDIPTTDVSDINATTLATPAPAAEEDDVLVKLWFPILFAFHDVIMNGEDLEVRSRALNYLFDTLVQYGGRFEPEFWDMICKQLLFPIFTVLRSRWEINQFNSHDDSSVWLSTTLIQALRNTIGLFSHYFETLSRMLDGFLDLLVTCICQENDTIARIGRSCLQQLITQNQDKFNNEQWSKITTAFETLFELTTAYELFGDDNRKLSSKVNIKKVRSIGEKIEGLDMSNENNIMEEEEKIEHSEVATNLFKTADEYLDDTRDEATKKKDRSRAIVVKCVLQLLMIESLSELFADDSIYKLVPVDNLIRLANLLERSYTFSRDFNDNKELRIKLWQEGFMKQLPNLLKQETSSVAVYFGITFKLYGDTDKTRVEQRVIIRDQLIPLCVTIIKRFVQLDEDTQQRNINTWRPVVVEILQGYSKLGREDFSKNAKEIYGLVLKILEKNVPNDLRLSVHSFLSRAGDIFLES